MKRRTVLKGIVASSLAPLTARRSRAQASKTVVRGVYASPGITYAPIFLATHLGLWAKNGLEAELKQLPGGPLAVVALTNGEADFAGVASTDPVLGAIKNLRQLSVMTCTGVLAMQYAARKEWLAKHGVSLASPLKDKLQAFKGARVGAGTIAGGPSQYTRYLIQNAGLDPNDLKFLAVGLGATRMAALRTDQVDIIVGSAPDCDQIELEGYGELFLNCGQDVPEFAEFPFTPVVVTPRFAEEKPDVVRRIAQTLGQGNDMFAERFGDVVDLMKKQYPGVPPRALERALERDKASFPRGGRMTKRMWDNNVRVSVEAKLIPSAPSTEEGGMWTNKFLT
ncbi:MAG: sulfonate transport system substrate-binding protein [Alphaproteobacteria bacterium]|nr:sulfonate transport system substrate-binding protein [Alphaproteobacteria bacterium]